MPAVHVGRQPIYDRALDVVGYELLFRAEANHAMASESGDYATTKVIVNTFTEFGLDRLVGPRLAFVNITRPFVVGMLPVPFAPETAVLELLESITADEETIAGAQRLKNEGYALALDDFEWEPERLALLPLVSYVKLDITGASAEQLAESVEKLRDQCPGVKLVAERVETVDDMELCHRLGFDHFQGYFLLRPDVVTARTIAPSHLASLQLLAKLADPDIDLQEIESIVRIDLGLNYRVLRASNAAANGSARKVETIRDALVMLGLQRLRSWMLLMVLSDAGKPDEEQLSTAMTRARTCELVASHWGGVRPESAFIVGLLSSLDILLGLSMDMVVERLPLADDLHDALVHKAGPLGRVLAAVLAYEAGDESVLGELPIDSFELSRAYLAAVGWSLAACESALTTS